MLKRLVSLPSPKTSSSRILRIVTCGNNYRSVAKKKPLFWYNRFCTFFIRFRGRWISLTLIRSLTRKVLPESQPTQHICILEIIFHASEVNRNDAWKRRRASIEWNLFQRRHFVENKAGGKTASRKLSACDKAFELDLITRPGCFIGANNEWGAAPDFHGGMRYSIPRIFHRQTTRDPFAQ